MRLLLVEDNSRLSALLSERLSPQGFCCDPAFTLQSAREHLDAANYDLIVLDLGLPDGDGGVWLRDQRGRRTLPPVLMLTARGGLYDRVNGLNAGADDFLAKPFEMAELVARLRALSRRPGVRTAPDLKVGDLTFATTSRTAIFMGAPLALSRREADLLELLVRHAPMLVTKELIDEALYSMDKSVTPNAVEAIVSRLRRKLVAAGGGDMLHTVRGIGYLMRARSDG